jgi:hypothetical protein
MENLYFKCLGYWDLGIKYLHLAESVSIEIVKNKNKTDIISDSPITNEMLEEQGRWSDTSLSIPLFFNFYHGIELTLKGFLYVKDSNLKLSHKLSTLLEQVRDQYPTNGFTDIIENYLLLEKLPNVLKTFCERSNVSIDQYYLALKYPEDCLGNDYCHTPLKYQRESGVPFFEKLVCDIVQIRGNSVKFSRVLFPDT